MDSDGQHNINQILSLVELAEDKSPTQRKFLYEKIGDFLVEEEAEFSGAERELMADILCRITSDVEKSVRAKFSKNISKNNEIPYDLAIFLANDDIEIALPILKDCGILIEEDLVQVIRTRSAQHQLAIAARQDISEEVSKALCETDNEEVCVSLICNHTAVIPDSLLEFLGDKSETIIAYQKPLLDRPFLPPHIAQKMYHWVSAALRIYITEQFDIDPALLELDSHTKKEVIQSISEETDPSSRLVDKLFSAGELSNGFLLKSLRQGEIDLFELSFAKLLDTRRGTVQQILYSKDPQLLAVACRVLGLDPVVFSTILELTFSANHEDAPLTSRQKEEVTGFYGLLKLDAAKRALDNPMFINGDIKYYQTN